MARQKGVTIGVKHFDEVTWYKDRSLIQLYLLCGVLILSSTTSGFDGSMMNGLQSLVYWQNYFHHPSASTLGLMNAIAAVGAIVAPPIVPWFADHTGRKFTIILGMFMITIGIALQTGAVNTDMFIAGRFFIGFGTTFSCCMSPVLITEISHPQHRAVITSIYNTCNYLGAIIAAWSTFGTLTIQNDWAWRAPSLLQVCPTGLQFVFIWFVPESPRYLIEKGKEAKAFAILEKYHGSSSGPELVEAEFNQIRETLELERSLSKYRWTDILASKGNRKRILIILALGSFSQLSGNSLVSYYISKILTSIGISNSKKQLEINGALMIYNWVISTVAALFVEKIGRRTLFLASTVGMLLFFTSWTICSAQFAMTGSIATSKGVLAFIFLFYLAYNSAFNGCMMNYAAEILPYHIRAKCYPLLALVSSGSALLSLYVNPIGLQRAGWKFYLFYNCFLVFEVLVVYFLFVETSNMSLEEIAKVFDGDDALVGGGELNHEKYESAGTHVEGVTTASKEA